MVEALLSTPAHRAARSGRPEWADRYPRCSGLELTGQVADLARILWEQGGKAHRIVGDEVVVGCLVGGGGRPAFLALLTLDPEVLRRDVLEATLGGTEARSSRSPTTKTGRSTGGRARSRARSSPRFRSPKRYRPGGCPCTSRRGSRRGGRWTGRSCSSRSRSGSSCSSSPPALLRPTGWSGARPRRPGSSRVRRQRLARSQDAALADPGVRRDARDGPGHGRSPASGVLPGPHPRERAPVPAHRQRARLLAHRGGRRTS